MKTILLCMLLIISSFLGYSQKSNFNPDSILVGNRKQPNVFLVGTFHFAYYNLDAHQTSKNEQVDILSKQKQNEIEKLIAYIKKFRPNKIAVEAGQNTSNLMQKYGAYKKGKKPLDKDEIEQIGFRLVDKLKLDTIYGVDAGSLYNDFSNGKDSLAFRPIIDSIYADYDFKSTDLISKLYSEYFTANDKMNVSIPILDYFKYLNSDKVLDRGFGVYLNGDFTLGNSRGADALAMYWYDRNLRIYRNIQKITTSPDDRILVLFGAGHIQILKNLFQCSPQYKLTKFNDLN